MFYRIVFFFCFSIPTCLQGFLPLCLVFWEGARPFLDVFGAQWLMNLQGNTMTSEEYENCFSSFLLDYCTLFFFLHDV